MKRKMKSTTLTIAAMMALTGQASGSWMDEWSGKERRQYRKAVSQMERIDKRVIGWGNERETRPKAYVVLDPPLLRPWGSEPKNVTVEFFATYVDPDGTAKAYQHMIAGVRNKWVPVLESIGWTGIYPYVGSYSITQGSGLDPHWNEKRKQIKALSSGIYIYSKIGFEKNEIRGRLLSSLTQQIMTGYRSLNSERDTRRIVEEVGEDWEEWKRLTRDHMEVTERVGRERWELLAGRAMEEFDGVFALLPDPVLLIEGKYLLTLNTVRRQERRKTPERLFQIANWLVREIGESKMRYGLNEEREFEQIRWDHKREPEADEVLVIDEPFSTENGAEVEVQWLFTYISDDGQAKSNSWLEDSIENWQDWLWEDGVNVTVTRGAIVSNRGHFLEHQRRHQRIANAWGGWKSSRQHALHRKMKEYLEKRPRGIGTENEEREVVKSTVPRIGYELYDEAVESEEAKQRIEELERKGALVSKLAQEQGQRRDPIFLVDGKYLLMTDSTIYTFQSLNWLIEKVVKERG